ncbi:SMC family ATPase [Myroides sp. DF42-4-2]|uniref:AAA family ATPase n=1 Tax=Myroides sp. DF42-4-2 TaxID=2746726 RepID=UPI0025772F02|nr:SMC family ATPase [Myroides sp. DF42-4-2]MDM1409058.1 SMC family ATPase [Myroides sp. DF42-4-2]
MIPIKLTLEGFYSYQDKQVIDFTQLIQAGLFGIFGKVGSGKSSILEAISFGLYGESERLNAQDKRAYNMMNLKSDRMSIDFEFSNFNGEKYRIYREFKRNSKRFEDVKRGDAVLYHWKDDAWIPLPDLQVEKVIGLSYENFKRTIIIPQGKFKEFIELGGRDRTKMMQEIFGLDRFDLAAKTKALYSVTRQRYDHLQGQLQRYALLTQEQIEEKKVAHQAEEKQLNQLVETFKKEQELFQQLKAVKSDFDTLENSKKEVLDLEAQEVQIQTLQRELTQYEQVDKAFRSLVKEQEQISAKIVEKQEVLAKKTQELQQKQAQYTHVKEEFAQVEKQFESLEIEKTTLYELQLILSIKQTEEARKALGERLQKGKEVVVQTMSELQENQQAIVAIEQQIQALKNNRMDPMRLMAIDKWFTDWAYLQQNIQDNQTKKSQLQDEIQKGTKALEALDFVNEEDWRLYLTTKRELNQEIQRLLVQELDQLRLSQQLAHYATALKEGEACPLCGALEHPAILAATDVSTVLGELERKQEKLRQETQVLDQREREVLALVDKRQLWMVQLSEINDQAEQKQKQLLQLLDSFVWTEIEKGNKNQFEELKIQAVQINQALEQADKQLQERIKKTEGIRSNVELYKAKLAEIELDQARLEADIAAKGKQIRLLNLPTTLQQEKETITQTITAKEQQIAQVDHSYKSLMQLMQQLAPALAALETEQNSLQQTLVELTQAKETLQTQIQQLLHTFQLEDLTLVKEILAKNIAVEETRERIQAFILKLEVLRNQVKQLTAKLESVAFDPERFLVQTQRVETLDQQVKNQSTSVVRLLSEIERMEQDYKEKASLLTEFDQVEKRLKNINLLDNMFKGAGFVNYVSSIYLRNLCDSANLRFHRLTNNQLSLQLNESNEFEIIDYLNNGKSRSVKTLSGGQSFQVSLSLALALAESVQSLSKSDKNFFFIDEGFGTQDTESVNIVFETLSSLLKENRIVGIISHVDELQERIPLSLSIVKDEERGSIIRTS